MKDNLSDRLRRCSSTPVHLTAADRIDALEAELKNLQGIAAERDRLSLRCIGLDENRKAWKAERDAANRLRHLIYRRQALIARRISELEHDSETSDLVREMLDAYYKHPKHSNDARDAEIAMRAAARVVLERLWNSHSTIQAEALKMASEGVGAEQCWRSMLDAFAREHGLEGSTK